MRWTEFNDWLAYRAPGSLTEGEVDQFLAGWWEAFERRNGRKPANATYRAQITALKGFYAYLDRSGNLVDDTRAASPEPAQADRYAKAGKTADRPPE